ncbi:hypothetical protein [Limnohabitans sp. T6-5]|uniref:hypothetical protein n=1 Tax=Limnohabitans sp. T6-5 TaxID=1100724 RepID=UPI0011B2919F|nr:hypothetical protein [Limnohabitans sp. T6-5]
MSKSDFRPPSLAQHFDPPPDYVGLFGWMVGFSADASFMNDAAERFTTYTYAQRASAGRIALALFLDPHNQPISLVDAPGVAHLPFKNLANRPCRLVHAKVAILGFRHTEHRDKWYLRLLVSTGNWTRQTLEESLDLAWAVDVSSDELNQAADEAKAACADIKAANNLMQWLRDGANGLFDVRLLQSNQATQDQLDVDGWIRECVKEARGIAPRFFDNRDRSMLAQLPQLVNKISKVSRNYLALGSGFYEGEKTTVPQKIIASLKDAGILTRSAEIDLFVNPTACQSIAVSFGILENEGVTVSPAKAPALLFKEDNVRTLHAKFLFSANYSNNSNKCNSSWIYLGSGNLTNPGFAKSMSANGGNLEAGIVFGADGLLWCGDKKGEPLAKVVTNLLPIEKDGEKRALPELKAGEGWEPEPLSHFAPPVPWLVWYERENASELRLPDSVAGDISSFVILNAAGANVQQNDESHFPWTGAQPQQVRCLWKVSNEERTAWVPVMDEFGRIAAIKLPLIVNMEEAWLQLSDFPNPPELHEPDETDGSAEDEGKADTSSNANVTAASNYPIRQMMELVEQIAGKQTDIQEHDWPLWCRRLEQTLIQAKGSKVVEYFANDLKMNPLAPLRHASFRPEYAEDETTDAGRRYGYALASIQNVWGVQDLSALGEEP